MLLDDHKAGAEGAKADIIAGLISIIIPFYNETGTLEEILGKTIDLNFPGETDKEIIIVDDGSTDDSAAVAARVIEVKNFKRATLIRKGNGGKGSAVRLGLEKAQGEISMIQDADLEYDPNDLIDVYNAFFRHPLPDAVYGSRILNARISGESPRRNRRSSIGFYLGGRFLTTVMNAAFRSSLTDAATCYKAFRTEQVREIDTKCSGFDWDMEITAALLKRGARIAEVPINYSPRSVAEGKKVRWIHGINSLAAITRVRFS